MEPVPLREAFLRLGFGALIVAAVWGVLLPRVLELATVREHVALMEARGVNPSAMYYTELERVPHRPPWIDDEVILWP